MRVNRQSGLLMRSIVKTWVGDWPRLTVPKSIAPGFRTMSLRMCEETASRASASRPLAVIKLTKSTVALGPTKLRVSISASITVVWPGATVEVACLAARTAAGRAQIHDRDRL